ncbi:MAG: hypothetical protein ABJI22_07675 [Maribacter sp.]
MYKKLRNLSLVTAFRNRLQNLFITFVLLKHNVITTMKNPLFISILSLLMLFSCSTNSENEILNDSSADNVLLIKQIVNTNGPQIDDFNYDGDKLHSIVDENGNEYIFSYNNNFINKVEYFNGSNSVLVSRNELFYTSNRLSLLKKYSNNELQKIINYEYNTDGSILLIRDDYDNGNTIVASSQLKVILDQNGNPIKTIVLVDNIEISNTTFIYDTLKTPFNDIIGFDALLLTDIFGEWKTGNNLLQSTTVTESSQAETIFTASYQYNSQGYPISGILTYESGTIDENLYSY